MFQHFQNSFILKFSLDPRGPLMVRQQQSPLEPGIGDMVFQRTSLGGQNTVCVPGSSLKGVVRSHVERIAKGQGLEICNLFGRGDDKSPCRDNRNRRNRKFWHDGRCPICFTFGTMSLAGRVWFGDAYPSKERWEETNQTEVRVCVGIDRAKQSARGGALFNAEVVTKGGFEVEARGENVSLWQIGFILQAFSDMNRGLLRLGGGTSRGFGQVAVLNPTFAFTTMNGSTDQLIGAESKKYHLGRDHNVLDLAGIEGYETENQGLFTTLTFAGDAYAALQKAILTDILAGYFKTCKEAAA